MKKRTFSAYETREAAEMDMKRRRKRKYTINYTEFWGCWVSWYND